MKKQEREPCVIANIGTILTLKGRKMDIRSQLGSSNYLKAADLQGQTVTVNILKVVVETVGQGKDATQKGVVYFQGKEKGLVLNTTNGNAIADVLGYETDNWTGAAIEIYPAKTDFGGRQVDCLRVNMPLQHPQAAPTQHAPPPQYSTPPQQQAPQGPPVGFEGTSESEGCV